MGRVRQLGPGRAPADQAVDLDPPGVVREPGDAAPVPSIPRAARGRRRDHRRAVERLLAVRADRAAGRGVRDQHRASQLLQPPGRPALTPPLRGAPERADHGDRHRRRAVEGNPRHQDADDPRRAHLAERRPGLGRHHQRKRAARASLAAARRRRRAPLLRHGPRANGQTPGITAGTVACSLDRRAAGGASGHCRVETAGGADVRPRRFRAEVSPAQPRRRRVLGRARLRADRWALCAERRKLAVSAGSRRAGAAQVAGAPRHRGRARGHRGEGVDRTPTRDLPRDARAVLRRQHPGRRSRQGRPLRGLLRHLQGVLLHLRQARLFRERRAVDGAGHGDGGRRAERGGRRVLAPRLLVRGHRDGLARRRVRVAAEGDAHRRPPGSPHVASGRLSPRRLLDGPEAQRTGPPPRSQHRAAPVSLLLVHLRDQGLPGRASGGAAASDRPGDRPESRADLDGPRRHPRTVVGLRAALRGRQRPLAVHRRRLSLRPEPRQVARPQQRKLSLSPRGRVVLRLVRVAVLVLVAPGTVGAQEMFRELSLAPAETACPRYRLMADDGEDSGCRLAGLRLAAADERPAGVAPPTEKKPRWLLAGLVAFGEVAVTAAKATITFDHTSFNVKDEGLFGTNTEFGGADKASHFADCYVITKEFSFIYGKLGLSDTAARLLAAGTAFTGGLVNEIADGFTKYGFSWGDLLMDGLGTGAALLVMTARIA